MTQNTRFTEKPKSLSDYIVTDDANCNEKTVFSFQLPSKSRSPRNSFDKKLPIGEKIDDSGKQFIANYHKDVFKTKVRDINWFSFYNQINAEDMYTKFLK